MKSKTSILGLLLFFLLLVETSAFTAGSSRTFRRSTQLHVDVLEGRKIGGSIKPVNNFILVKTMGKREKTDDGILIAGESNIIKTEGTVVAVGPGKTHPETGRVLDIPLVPGDGVIYGEYDGTEIILNEESHMLIRDDNVLVKFHGGKFTLDNVDVINDSVLVEVNTNEQESAGGVILTQSKSDEKRPSTGIVKKVGRGKMAGDGSYMPMTVLEGESVKFLNFAGNEITIEGQDYSVVQMPAILAKF